MEHSGMVVSFKGCLGEIRCYGTVEHSGFGSGFERMVLFAIGIDKIQDNPGELDNLLDDLNPESKVVIQCAYGVPLQRLTTTYSLKGS
ncbi:glutamine--tRNA ligase-like protein, partial [Tanacetum coccineum]